MITDEQFSHWSQTHDKSPVLLIEITHATGTVYLSNRMYVTHSGESPPDISYDVCLKQSVIVERTLGQDSIGAIRVYNDGSLDDWIDHLWEGYTVEVFIGDIAWDKSDFRRQYKGTIDTFSQLSPDSYEFKSTKNAGIVQTSVNANRVWLAGTHLSTLAIYFGSVFYGKRYRIADVDQYDKSDVSITYNGVPASLTWIDDRYTTNTFYATDYYGKSHSGVVRFSASGFELKFKSFFANVCAHVGQPLNLNNLAAYPVDPDITFYLTSNMSFPDFLTLSLETIGAVSWINDSGELELYRKELPEDGAAVDGFITVSDKPQIRNITVELPVKTLVVKNPDHDHTSGAGPHHYMRNTIPDGYPSRVLNTFSYASNDEAIIEGERLSALLSTTRRTYSIKINRISPELFIGAIVNVVSPKDRWSGLNALVVGLTHSFTTNQSEVIVWR